MVRCTMLHRKSVEVNWWYALLYVLLGLPVARLARRFRGSVGGMSSSGDHEHGVAFMYCFERAFWRLGLALLLSL